MLPFENKAAEPTESKDIKSPYKPVVEAVGKIFRNIEPVNFDPKIDCPPRACYNCWSFNHQTRYCRQPKSHEFCCNCGRKGVSVNKCVRCSKAFYELDISHRKWIYRVFFGAQNQHDESKKHTMEQDRAAAVNWKYDRYQQSFHSRDCKHSERSAATKENRKESCISDDDDDFGWEAYIEPNELFTNMRTKKIKEELSSDEINNVAAVNLNETRMAERNSFGENSVLSDHMPRENWDEKESSKLSGEPLNDFLCLLDAVKHMSVSTQETIVLQFMSERKKLSEVQSVDKN